MLTILRFQHERGTMVATVERDTIVQVVELSRDGQQFTMLRWSVQRILGSYYGQQFNLAQWFHLKIGKGWNVDKMWQIGA